MAVYAIEMHGNFRTRDEITILEHDEIYYH